MFAPKYVAVTRFFVTSKLMQSLFHQLYDWFLWTEEGEMILGMDTSCKNTIMDPPTKAPNLRIWSCKFSPLAATACKNASTYWIIRGFFWMKILQIKHLRCFYCISNPMRGLRRSFNQKLMVFKVRPKLHYIWHQACQIKEWRINMGVFATWSDESFLGKIKLVATACHGKTMTSRVYQRYLLCLAMLVHRHNQMEASLGWLYVYGVGWETNGL